MLKSPLASGHYDHILTHGLRRAVELAREQGRVAIDEPLDEVALRRHLVGAVAEVLERALVGRGADEQVALANGMLSALDGLSGDVGGPEGLVAAAHRLVSLTDAPHGLVSAPTLPPPPQVPLGRSALLTHHGEQPTLAAELAAEIATADEIDVLVAFLKWSGYRLLREPLRAFAERKGGKWLRVLTTSYLGVTEKRVLDDLASLGAEVRVSLDVAHTRLHAKAWLFRRDTELHTAYVGSSNLSGPAMTDGREWNVRLSARDNAGLIDEFQRVFAAWWYEPESGFEGYDAPRFEAAIAEARGATARLRGGGGEEGGPTAADYARLVLAFEHHPRPHQRAMLDALAAERAHGHTRNLVVAATGTGKTHLAAFDFARWQADFRAEHGRAARLLFVAHRQEILRAARDVFRSVLRDPSFGELLVGGEVPQLGAQVFASVQSLGEARVAALAPDAYDFVVIDEAHHAPASSWSRLIEHLQPAVLLGLTATPERADGGDLLRFFGHRIATELRLWDALSAELLAPFHYFGVHDAVVGSLKRVKWARGSYDTEALSNLLTADDAWAGMVLREVLDKVPDVGQMRALGFCVSVRHAEFMAAFFNKRGLRALAVTGQSSAPDRASALRDLGTGNVRVVFTVDLYNEGVDIPSVDTLLMLRPTESATLFLQQLGRGLRPSRNKGACTVLDFIADAHREFRFDQRFAALAGGTRRQVKAEVEAGFAHLPSGCAIQLDRQATEVVLDNIKAHLGVSSLKALAADLRTLDAETGLFAFVRQTGATLAEIYAGGRGFASVRRAAGRLPGSGDATEEALLRAFGRCLHVDDDARLDAYLAVLDRPEPPAANAHEAGQRGLFGLLTARNTPLTALADQWRLLWQRPHLRTELLDLFRILRDDLRHTTQPMPHGPLRVGGSYTLVELMAAYDSRTGAGAINLPQTGVIPLKAARTELLLVTLDKSEGGYSEQTRYDDRPLGPDRFQWQTQNTVGPDSPAAQRYRDPAGQTRFVLLVRARKKDTQGNTAPYVCLGEVAHESSSGAKPMTIIWRLRTAMPARLAHWRDVA